MMLVGGGGGVQTLNEVHPFEGALRLSEGEVLEGLSSKGGEGLPKWRGHTKGHFMEKGT